MEIFRGKLAPKTVYQHTDGRWRQFHDILFEVYAYEWLRSKKNAQNIKFVPEAQKRRTPDLEGTINGCRVLVEVKNINESDAGNKIWGRDESITVMDLVPTKLCDKIEKVYLNGIKQLEAGRVSEDDLMFFYLVYEFDLDFEPAKGPENDFRSILNQIEKEDYPIIYHRRFS